MNTSSTPWIRYGCSGCAAIVVLIAMIGAFLYLLADSKARTSSSTAQSFSFQPPGDQNSRGTDQPQPKTLVLPTDQSGRIILTLADASFDIRPGAIGQPVTVRAEFDTESYELIESSRSDDSWLYEVQFQRRGWSMLVGFAELLGAPRPKLEILLPPDRPYHLELQLARGGAEADLGGLHLKSADLQFEQGGLQLEFGEPLVEPIERLAIDGSMGGFQVSKLGNASPRELYIDCSMGGVDLDLRGQWQQDADVSIRTSMGGTIVTLPTGVDIQGLARESAEFPDLELAEVPRPVIRFDVDVSMGELVITD